MSRGKGFAGMTPERRSEIARLGGQSTPDEDRSFSKDRRLASEAGRKGGLASVAARRAKAAKNAE